MKTPSILVATSLYPSAARPNHGVFVENRLRQLIDRTGMSATVVAPVPWFPCGAAAFGDWGTNARVPRVERRHGIAVHHPRYPVIPRFGMSLAPGAMAWALKRTATRLVAEGLRFDLVDAHYLYPDAIAAASLARHLGIPFVATARGSDVTQIMRMSGPGRRILSMAAQAAHLVTVSAALRDELVRHGVPADRVTTLRNGVDTETFRPGEPPSARRTGRLLCVGHLIARKRQAIAIGALAALTDRGTVLDLAGSGPDEAALRALAARVGVADRVRFLGQVPHDGLAGLYSGADLSLLCSSREGWANVLLESMACGTRVVASDIPGNDEVVREPRAGRIVRSNDAPGFAAAIEAALGEDIPREETRRYAEEHSWDATSDGQARIMAAAIAGR